MLHYNTLTFLLSFLFFASCQSSPDSEDFSKIYQRESFLLTQKTSPKPYFEKKLGNVVNDFLARHPSHPSLKKVEYVDSFSSSDLIASCDSYESLKKDPFERDLQLRSGNKWIELRLLKEEFSSDDLKEKLHEALSFCFGVEQQKELLSENRRDERVFDKNLKAR